MKRHPEIHHTVVHYINIHHSHSITSRNNMLNAKLEVNPSADTNLTSLKRYKWNVIFVSSKMLTKKEI